MLREVSRSAAHFMVTKHEVARRQSKPGTGQRDLEIGGRVAGYVGTDDVLPPLSDQVMLLATVLAFACPPNGKA